MSGPGPSRKRDERGRFQSGSQGEGSIPEDTDPEGFSERGTELIVAVGKPLGSLHMLLGV